MIVVLENNPKIIQAMKKIAALVNPVQPARYFGNSESMIQWLERNLAQVRFMSLRYNQGQIKDQSGRSVHGRTGMDVVSFLTRQEPMFPVLLHSDDLRAIAEMSLALTWAGWSNVVIHRDDGHWLSNQWLPRVVDTIHEFEAGSLLISGENYAS